MLPLSLYPFGILFHTFFLKHPISSWWKGINIKGPLGQDEAKDHWQSNQVKGIHFLGYSCALHFQYSWKKCGVSNDPGFLPESQTYFHTKETYVGKVFNSVSNTIMKISDIIFEATLYTLFVIKLSKRNHDTEYNQNDIIQNMPWRSPFQSPMQCVSLMNNMSYVVILLSNLSS